MERAPLKTAAMAGAALALGTFAVDAFVAPSSGATTTTTQPALRASVAAAAKTPAQSGGSIMAPLAVAAPAALVAAAMVSKRSSRRVAMKYDASGEKGVTAPMGYFDPCNFLKDADEATFLDYREKELKHGRAAMLSIVGFLVQPFAGPGHIGFEGVPGGCQALFTYPGSAGMGVLFLIAGFFELRILPDLAKAGSPGNFNDPLRFAGNFGGGQYDDKWRNFELNNCRLAMFGSIGTITAGFYTGYDAYEQWSNAKPVAIDFIKSTLQNAAP